MRNQQNVKVRELSVLFLSDMFICLPIAQVLLISMVVLGLVLAVVGICVRQLLGVMVVVILSLLTKCLHIAIAYMVGTTQSLPVVLVIMESILLVYEGQTMLETPMLRGGGNRSTQPTKTFGRGTELPREGDASCVIFNRFKSGLAARLKRFVHFQLATSICQAIRQVQQTFMAARGHLSQMVDFGEQVAHGIVQAVSQHTNLLLMKCQITPIVLMFFSSIKKIKEQLDLYIIQETPRKEVLLQLMSVVEPHITTCRLTAPVIAGIAQPSYIGGVY